MMDFYGMDINEHEPAGQMVYLSAYWFGSANLYDCPQSLKK